MKGSIYFIVHQFTQNLARLGKNEMMLAFDYKRHDIFGQRNQNTFENKRLRE